jgi:NAD(P)-dependent dehydrogenase (short-subunit alcohol dehydrogenase family)
MTRPDFNERTLSEDVVRSFASHVQGRTFLITGPNTRGLGGNTARYLALGSPKHIILLGRHYKEQVEPVQEDIAATDPNVETTFIECDLSDQDDVRKTALAIAEKFPIIDVIINNAGIMTNQLERDNKGNEMTLSSSHIGHFLLTNLLMPQVLAAGPGARIITMSSIGHQISPFRFDDYNFESPPGFDGWSAYGQAKTASILFSIELTRRLKDKGILSFAVHPGSTWTTDISKNLTQEDFVKRDVVALRNTGMEFVNDWPEQKSMSEGTATTLRAALDPELTAEDPTYMVNCNGRSTYSYAQDAEIARKLWTLSEKLVGQEFDLVTVANRRLGQDGPLYGLYKLVCKLFTFS